MKMKLSKPVNIPDQYKHIVLTFLRNYWDDVLWELRNHFGIEIDIADLPVKDDDYLRLMVASPIEDIAQAAAGGYSNVDPGVVYESIQGLVEKLFSVPGESGYTIPQDFWSSPFGSMVALALLWSQGEELITMSEAAKISGKSVSSLSQLVDRGRIRSYPDMTEPNPTRRNRLVKSEVKALKKKKK